MPPPRLRFRRGRRPLQAADATKVALVPGGPHPYFAAWEKAGQDAMKDFKLGAADYRVPQKWELSQQNSLLESLLSQGYNAFLVFPGDPVGSNSTVQRTDRKRRARHRDRRLPEGADDRARSASAPTPAIRPISAPRN